MPVQFPRAAVHRLIAIGSALVLLDGHVLEAHQLGLMRVRLLERLRSQYVLEIKLPFGAEGEAIPIFPERCHLIDRPAIRSRQAIADVRLLYDCGDAPLSADDAMTFPWPVQGAFVAVEWRDGSSAGRFFDAGAQGVTISLGVLTAKKNRTAVEIVRRYLQLGVEHILTGWDHLAFVLALCLIASGWRLLQLVSAFTVGHSLTLAVAALGFVHVPPAATEGCIALSIAFVAREGIRQNVAHGAGLVFAFGLLHGLGFATALAESGIERSEFLLGLSTFNVGVELGQLLFVGTVLCVIFLGGPLSIRSRRSLADATGYALGALGVFWTLQRTLFYVR